MLSLTADEGGARRLLASICYDTDVGSSLEPSQKRLVEKVPLQTLKVAKEKMSFDHPNTETHSKKNDEKYTSMQFTQLKENCMVSDHFTENKDGGKTIQDGGFDKGKGDGAILPNPRRAAVSGIDPRRAAVSGIDPRRAAVSGIDPRRAAVSGIDPRRAAVSGIDPRRAAVSGIDPRRAAVSGIDPRRAAVSGIDPRRAAVSGIDPRRAAVSGIDPRRAAVSGIDPRRAAVSGIDPRRAAVSGIRN